MRLYCKHVFLIVPGSSVKVIIDILFPRLIFNLTLAFRALTEKLGCGVGEGGDPQTPKPAICWALRLVLPGGAWWG